MRFFGPDEATRWCEVQGLKVTSDRYLCYQPESQHSFTIGLEEKPSSLIGLVDCLLPAWEDTPFKGALLWIKERGIWGDHSENTGAMIVELMRLAKGEKASLAECPAHLFGPHEALETHSFCLMPMLFGWDAFFVPEGADHFVFVSHDGVGEVVTRTAEKSAELRQRVRDWKPQEDRGWYQALTHVDSSTEFGDIHDK